MRRKRRLNSHRAIDRGDRRAALDSSYFRHRQELQEKIVALERLVEGNDIEGAKAFVESLPSELRKESRIAELIGRHDQNVTNAEDRKNRFRTLHGGLLEDIGRETRLNDLAKLEIEYFQTLLARIDRIVRDAGQFKWYSFARFDLEFELSLFVKTKDTFLSIVLNEIVPFEIQYVFHKG